MTPTPSAPDPAAPDASLPDAPSPASPPLTRAAATADSGSPDTLSADAPAADALARRLSAFCDAELPWLLETIEALVRIESPSTDKAAVDRCGAELATRLAQLDRDARVTRIANTQAGDILRAEYGSGDTQVLILGHFDTVWGLGTLARMPLERRDGKLFGPGTFDMKAGIGIAMLACRALAAVAPGVPIRRVMLWTTDEEIGSRAARALIEDEARRSAAVFVLEPSLPNGVVKTSRKGVGEFTIEVQGVSAHAGIDPAKGVSAIHELAHLITQLAPLNDLARGSSVNAGVIEGGTRSNVIAEHARAVVDVRVAAQADAQRVEAFIRGLTTRDPRARLTITGGIDRPPLERSAGVVRLYDQARAVARALGRELGEGSTGGGSDGNFTAALGVPTLDGLGAIGDGAHAVHEHVEIGTLSWRAALLAGVIARLADSALHGRTAAP
jgi:glutamate carboxypeptidase